MKPNKVNLFHPSDSIEDAKTVDYANLSAYDKLRFDKDQRSGF